MNRPRSPRVWLNWSLAVRERRHSPRSAVLEHGGRGDRRTNDSYETALSVLSLLERSSNSAGPEGARLVLDVATGTLPWHGLSANEQNTVIKISRRFAQALAQEGFLPSKDGGGRRGNRRCDIYRGSPCGFWFAFPSGIHYS